MNYQPLQVLSCSEGGHCVNSIETKGEAAGRCGFCRLAPGNEALPNHYWKATHHCSRTLHPALALEKRLASIANVKALRQKRLDRDPCRQKTARIAAKAERETEANIIKATKNSGRSNRDGDHVVAGGITMDTKLQSTRINPVVLLHELAKVQSDAKRAGTRMGCLNIRNKHGIGVVVMDELDFARILSSKEPT